MVSVTQAFLALALHEHPRKGGYLIQL